VGIFLPNSKEIWKNRRKGKGKERNRKVTYLLFGLYLMWSSDGLLIFFDKIEIKMIDLFVMFKN